MNRNKSKGNKQDQKMRILSNNSSKGTRGKLDDAKSPFLNQEKTKLFLKNLLQAKRIELNKLNNLPNQEKGTVGEAGRVMNNIYHHEDNLSFNNIDLPWLPNSKFTSHFD